MLDTQAALAACVLPAVGRAATARITTVTGKTRIRRRGRRPVTGRTRAAPTRAIAAGRRPGAYGHPGAVPKHDLPERGWPISESTRCKCLPDCPLARKRLAHALPTQRKDARQAAEQDRESPIPRPKHEQKNAA